MQVYIIIMEGNENFSIANGLVEVRLTWSRLMSL